MPTPADKDAETIERFQERLGNLPDNRVAGEIPGIAQDWSELDISDMARRQIAQAIIDKVAAVKREKKSAGKGWYQLLLASVNEDAG